MKPLDKLTFEALFKSEFKNLVCFAIHYVKDLDTAREIVQETFLAVWQKKDSLDLSKPVKSYLTTSVKNKCLNYLRDQKKFSDEVIDFAGTRLELKQDATDKVIEAELRDRISLAISELPEKCREIFLLSRNESMKYNEIAEKLDISVKTVETQMSKALIHMRIRLSEYLKL